jgi:type IV secretory pathway TrbD component
MPTPSLHRARTDLAPTRIYPSLVRPILFAGVEREAMIPTAGLCFILLLAFRPNLLTPLLALLIVLRVLPWLRRLSRRDPMYWKLLRRHLHRAGFYPPRADHDRPRFRAMPTL